MLKLYKFTDNEKLYWETWDNEDSTYTVHWGVLGTEGKFKSVKAKSSNHPPDSVQNEIDKLTADGYSPIYFDDHFTLIIEYQIQGMGTDADIDKRHRLEDRMNETLGWTGLGECDGGSIGSGTMEVCNYVVDFALAKQVIEADLKGSEFANYTRIYDEDA